MNEIAKAMAKMKKGRSPSEVLKAGGTTVLEQPLNICNRAYETEMVPSDWQKGIVGPIFKKGEKTICDNHRGITLLSHAGKIFTRIVETRLRECVEGVLDPSQYGFRPGRSTIDAVFIVKMLLKKSWEWGIDQYALFVDLDKAFDRVNRNNLWKVLKENRYNIPTKLIRVICSIYSQCTSKVKKSKIESEAFSIESGVRQGDVLSPLLFIIFMDRCIRDVTIGQNGEETVMYADDVGVVAHSLTNIQEVASRLWRGMSQNGMKINTRKGKTEIVHISRHTMQCEAYM